MSLPDINIRPGIRIRINGLEGVLTVKLAKRVGSQIQLEFITESGEYKTLVVMEESVEILPETSYDMMGNADLLFLGVEKRRFETALRHEPLLGMQNVDPVPHQIEAVYDRVMSFPKIRYMLAHDAGAGKTIMAGLIVKELKARGVISRYCIIAPGKLAYQWKREMSDKFGEDLKTINRNVTNEAYGENVWNSSDAIITSMDFAKQPDSMDLIGKSDLFDLIIVDEAHRMSASWHGSKIDRTDRYKLGQLLSGRAHHLLFLTATPHKGDPQNFKLFMDLLEPGLATDDMIHNPQSNQLFLKRSKEQMVDMEGNKLFKDRKVETQELELKGMEKEVYDLITEYVKSAYVKADMMKNRISMTFAIIQLQKRAASSMMAILRTLERRKDKLTKRLGEENPKEQTFDVQNDYDDLPDDERERKMEQLEDADVSSNREELTDEIMEIGDLIASIKKFMGIQDEAKLVELKRLLGAIDRDEPGAKLLVFSESRVTMDYVTSKLVGWGYSVVNIHGGMGLEQRVSMEREFKDSVRIMVATEAAGEGINLQFCHYMINYDIPWNPNVLEQRMGRIHRYGQSKNVLIWNMVAGNTREGMVIAKLLDKLRQIRLVLGPDIYDVVGQIIPGKALDDLFRDALSGRATDDMITKNIAKAADDYVKYAQAYKESGLIPLNVESIRATIKKAEQRRLGPTNVRDMLSLAIKIAGGRIQGSGDVFSVITPKQLIRKGLERRYNNRTFNKQTAKDDSTVTFMRFGEPLFDGMMRWIGDKCGESIKRGAVFASEDMDGYITFHECVIKNGKMDEIDRRMLAHYVGNDGEIRRVEPYVLCDLEPITAPDASGMPDMGKVESVVLAGMGDYIPEIQVRVDRNTAIRKNGLQSLNIEIADLERQEEEAEGSDAYKLANEKRKCMERLEKFEKNIDWESSIFSSFDLFTVVRVVPTGTKPAPKSGVDNRSVVEHEGMKHVMDYETKKGRRPVDVSQENKGWDIESTDKAGNRMLIEVKGKAGKDEVMISENEWKKAEEYGDDYYLYVVFDALKTKTSTAYTHGSIIIAPQEENQHYNLSQSNRGRIMNRRLIGESLPLKLISEESVNEKSMSVNQISSIHQWFARRPLTSSRSTAYASLIDPSSDGKTFKRIAKTLEDLSIYANKDNLNVLELARRDILESNGGVSPKVLDPFGGGGAIPLECIRLGCETYSNDYNPVAYIIQKCTLEYPLKYGSVSLGTRPEDSKFN